VSILENIADFATGDGEATPGQYQLVRTTASAYDANGKPVAGASTTSLVTACVQPTSGRGLRILLEAGVTEESREVWTEGPLLTRRPGQEPDVMMIDGEAWVCHHSKRWEYDGEVFYVSLVARRSQQ
jgi:hypothetical protein